MEGGRSPSGDYSTSTAAGRRQYYKRRILTSKVFVSALIRSPLLLSRADFDFDVPLPGPVRAIRLTFAGGLPPP